MIARLLLIGCLVITFASLGCKRDARQNGVVDYGALRELVIKHVKDGSISPDNTGKASLPEDEKAVCSGGCIYVSSDAIGGLLLVFVDSDKVDGLSPASGLLYCEDGVTNLWSARRVRIANINWMLVRPQDSQFCSVVSMQ